MVKYCVHIVDSNGNPIPSNSIKIHSYDSDLDVLKVIINDGSDLITQSDWKVIELLLIKAIDYGGGVEEIRNYIELYDKIKKIINQNDCK